MEQQPAAANEGIGRLGLKAPGVRLPLRRSRSSTSGHDDDDDDNVNGHALRRPAGEGRASGDEPSLVRETAPARAEEPTALSWQLKYGLRKAAIVDLPDDLKKLSSCPVIACDPPGSREAIVMHPGCDGDAPLQCKLECFSDIRDAQYEHLTLGTLWVTPAYLILLAADSDLPALMKLMNRISHVGVDLDVHLDIEVVESLVGPETMEVDRLRELVDHALDRDLPGQAIWGDLPVLALLRIHAMALQDVGNSGGDYGDIFYQSYYSPENILIQFRTRPRDSRSLSHVQISRVHLGRMMRLVKDLPARGFDGFLRGGLPTTDYPLPIIHHQISTTDYPLPIIHYRLSTTHYPPLITHYPLSTTDYPPPIIHH